MEPLFLTLDEVLEIHDQQVELYGGSAGLRDAAGLESAVATPQATFGGEYLHPSIPAMAAAYLFHLCQNHPFIDGNKRVAAFSCVLFLSLNGTPDDDLPQQDDLERVTLSIASGEMTKADVTAWLHSVVRQPP